MSATAKLMQDAVTLAHAQLQNYKKLSVVETQPVTESTDIPAPTCAVGDKECINRWVQAFSDCD